MRVAAQGLRAQLALREELRDALAPLRVRQVREFVLGTDALYDASVVTAAEPQSRSIALRICSDSEAVGDFDDNFSFRVVSNWLFLPAVEQPAFSLGVHLSKDDRQTRVGLLKPGFAVTRYRRYVRDHVHGVHVSVGHYDDGTELMYLRGLGHSLRHRSGKVFRFNTEPFNKLMGAAMAAGTVPDVDSLLECLNLVYTFEEDRHCPVCAAPPGTQCACTQSATDPLDMTVASPLKRSVYNNRGEYEGGAVIELMAGGMLYRSIHSTRLTTVDLSEHRSLGPQLIEWAVRDRIGALSPTLTKLVMPARGHWLPELMSSAPAMNTTSLSEFVLRTAAANAPPAIGFGGGLDRADFAVADAHAGDLLPAGEDNDMTNLALPTMPAMQHPSLAPEVPPKAPAPEIPPKAPAPASAPPFVARRPRPPRTETQGQLTSVSPVTPVFAGADTVASPLLSNMSSGSGPRSGQSAPRSPLADADAADAGDGSASSGGEGGIPDTIVRGLQVIKAHGGSTKITRERLSQIVPMRDRDIAKTFRRARNREAAAKSNLKRKVRLQALRTNLADVRRRKVECSERYEMLAQENEALRAALAATGAVVPRRA